MATVFWKYGPYINPKPLNPKGPKPLSHPTAAISKVSGALFSAISAGFFLPTGSETLFCCGVQVRV